MGDLTFIRDGIATHINYNGQITKSLAFQCDDCFKWSDGLGGRAVRDVAREIVIWLCSECRR